MINKKNIFAVVVNVFTIVFFVTIAHAETVTTDAAVEIINAPQITEVQSLDFGKVLRPTAGTNDIRVTSAGVRSVQGGGDANLAGGTIQAARYTIDAVVGRTFDLEATLNTGSDTLSMSTFTGRYDSSAEIGADPADNASFTVTNASADLYIGADLDNLTSATAVAVHTLTFNVDINYQ